MSDRLVNVTLRAAVAGYNRDILSSAAVTGLLADRIDAVSGRMGSFSQNSSRALDYYSGRLRVAIDLAAALGPSLVPIGAIGIPILAGAASSAGFLAVGLGAVIASTNGVSGALKALNKYALDPTDANLDNVHDTLLKLGPDAQAFVLQLRGLGPELKQIRDAGAGELFPHWRDSIEALETLLPTIEELVSRVARKAGEISEQGAESLAGPRWTEFYSFLEQETPRALGKIGHAVGDLAHATSELWMAFDPLNDDFLNVLMDGADAIDKWATGLDKTKGFQEFIDYVETNGPVVGETIGAIAMALLDIVEAAAPIGAATLPILESVADILGVIADSDLGTPLLGVLALSRAFALLNRGMQAGVFTDLKTMGRNDPWGAALTGGLKEATKQTEAYNAATARTRTRLLQLGGAGGAVAGFMAIQSGLADKIGLTNTVMGASIGLMAGPWGAAVGAGIGLVMDLADSQDRATVSAESLADAIDLQTGAFTEAAYAKVGEAFADLADEADLAGVSLSEVIRAAIEGGSAYDDLAHKLQAVIDADTYFSESGTGQYLGDQALAASDLAYALSGQNAEANKAIDIAKGRKAGLDAAADSEIKAGDAAEHAVNPTRAVADAIAELGGNAEKTTTAAEDLKAALDSLLDPALNVSAAWDEWNVGLRDINDNLSKHGNALKGMSVAATENREEIRARVNALKDMIQAEADAGVKGPKLAEILRNQTKALLNAGDAAGLSRSQLKAYLNTLGLTPKLIETVLKVVGDEEAKRQARDVKKGVEGIPDLKTVTIEGRNSQALAAIAAVQRARDALRDKLITITVAHQGVQSQPGHGGGGGDPGNPSGRTTLGGTDGRGLIGSTYYRSYQTNTGGKGDGKGGGMGGPPPGSATHGPYGFDTLNQHEVDKAIRAAFEGLKLSLADGAQSIRRELAELESDLKHVGGVWNDAMEWQAAKILRLAKTYDYQAKLLEDQQQVLESLNSTLSDQQQAMQAFGAQVAGNFTSDPFGHGLGGFFKTTGLDTANATMFDQVLQQLSVMGLDGPAYQALAASGDIKTAQQLAASGMIDAFESAIANRDLATGALSNRAAVDSGMVAQSRATALAISNQTAVVQASLDVMSRLETKLQGLREDLKGETGIKMAKENGRELGKVLDGVAAGAKRQAH